MLEQILAKRYEKAGLLGFKNWADYVTADKMECPFIIFAVWSMITSWKSVMFCVLKNIFRIRFVSSCFMKLLVGRRQCLHIARLF